MINIYGNISVYYRLKTLYQKSNKRKEKKIQKEKGRDKANESFHKSPILRSLDVWIHLQKVIHDSKL